MHMIKTTVLCFMLLVGTIVINGLIRSLQTKPLYYLTATEHNLNINRRKDSLFAHSVERFWLPLPFVDRWSTLKVHKYASNKIILLVLSIAKYVQVAMNFVGLHPEANSWAHWMSLPWGFRTKNPGMKFGKRTVLGTSCRTPFRLPCHSFISERKPYTCPNNLFPILLPVIYRIKKIRRGQ